ncbi:hypothetical protein GA0070610_1785 [Micromonospora echinofusca]|uniref:Uncharacterized protein n=1 Tax=Micromonospora echinofusca TaxID=47858 RepID=A0A1C5G716_MICEH|nr:hypothetical protein [Micromonospora echinofusca]SCG15551.1 hypothetical protein GA0070610_1785 [Micromonospora echinofusca]
MAIDARLVRDGLVDVEAFTAAAEAGAVGVCDGCAGLLDGSAQEGGGLVWLTTSCRACGAERTAPGGRALARRAGRRPGPPAWLLEAAAELDARRLGERSAQ